MKTDIHVRVSQEEKYRFAYDCFNLGVTMTDMIRAMIALKPAEKKKIIKGKNE